MRKKKSEEENESQEKEVPTLKYDMTLHWASEENRLPIRAARDLYFKEYPYERIFLATGVPPSVFLARSKKWIKVKDRVDQKLIENIRKKAISDQSTEYIEKGLQVGLKFINRLLKRETEITPKDWKLVSDSIMAIHRVRQLETGKPTDISVYKDMSPEEVGAYLLQVQKELAAKHDMTMFAPSDDMSEEQLVQEFNKNGDSSDFH